MITDIILFMLPITYCTLMQAEKTNRKIYFSSKASTNRTNHYTIFQVREETIVRILLFRTIKHRAGSSAVGFGHSFEVDFRS